MTNVVIFSNGKDESTNLVCEWILYYGHKPKVVRPHEIFSKTRATISIENNTQNSYIIGEFSLNPQNESSMWFRRDEYISLEDEVSSDYASWYSNEVLAIKRSFMNGLSDFRCLSDYDSMHISKFEVLKAANELGLVIPNTMITTSKTDLYKWINLNGYPFIKPFSENMSTKIKGEYFLYKNFTLSEDSFKALPDIFFPTLFQESIDILMEIRVFYINGRFFPMAIIGNENAPSYKDNYASFSKTPISISYDLERKLHLLIKRLALNTCSIDLIVERHTNRFIFIEVNPNGQFGMTSMPCNYYLEREIAKFLCHEK